MAKRPEADRPDVAAERVRQGRIILRTRTQRVVFIGGLAGIVLLPLVVLLASRLM